MPEMRRPMKAGEALYYALTGRSPRSEGRGGTQGRVRELLKAMGGSTRKVAEAVGVSQRTVQRWLRGEQEARNTARARNADGLVEAQRRARIKPGRVALLTGAVGPGGGLRVYGCVRVSEDERYRWINIGSHLPQGALDHLVDTLAQDPEAAGAELNRLISTYYVAGMSVTDIEAIEYE